MGGIGSTRWRGARTRGRVEQCYSISARLMRGCAALPVGALGVWAWPGKGVFVFYDVAQGASGCELALDYSWRGRSFAQRVALVSTEPHYGGVRWWFLCPGCSRRVRDLHLPGYSRGPFLCRHCHDLSYEMAQITRSGITYGLFCNMARAAGVTRGAARRMVRRRIGGYVHEPKLIGAGLLAGRPEKTSK